MRMMGVIWWRWVDGGMRKTVEVCRIAASRVVRKARRRRAPPVHHIGAMSVRTGRMISLSIVFPRNCSAL